MIVKCFYEKRYVGGLVWLVCSKHIFEDNYPSLLKDNLEYPTKFMRVRVVTISHDGFMNCSCGHQMRWYKPCVHMACIIDDPEFYVPEMFHIRWWKHFHYILKSKHSMGGDNSIYKHMCDALKYTRLNHFDSHSAKFKEIPLNGTSFLQYIKCNYHSNDHDNVTVDEKMKIMTAIQQMQDNNQPLINGSMIFANLICNTVSKYNDNHNGDNDDLSNDSLNSSENDDHNIETMGAGSQVMSQLSDYREGNNSSKRKATSIDTSDGDDSIDFFEEIDPVYKELLHNIKSKSQLDEAITSMQKLSFKFAAEGMKNRVIGETETTFLGEQNGTRIIQKRHRNRYEKK